MLPKPGRVTPGFFPYLPAVSLLGFDTLGAGAYFSLGRIESTGVGSQASFSPGVVGLSPLNDPSGFRARRRFGRGLLLSVILLLHLCH